MSDRSTIEWTDATWNPIRGCTKISPGCKHCYPETFAERFRGVPGHPYEQGFDLRLIPGKLTEPLRWSTSRRIFVNSMSDLFHEGVPDDYITAVARVMVAANWHTFQVLTKRADRLRRLLSGPLRFATVQPHIWWGVSIENRRHGLPRIEELRSSPAIVRFLSIEPLLEDLRQLDLEGIHWVIVGGESGSKARPIEAAWVESIQQQCARAGVPFFFKQWGGVRKHLAGRELNGQTYDSFPPTPMTPPPNRARRLQLLAEVEAIAAMWQPSPPGDSTRHAQEGAERERERKPDRAVEEFDRLMAIRMVAPYREIRAESLEAYWRQWESAEISEDPSRAPGWLVDEFGELTAGEAVIHLPNGERWVFLSALGLSAAFADVGFDNTFLLRLHALLMEHKVRRHHMGSGLPSVLLNAGTLDPMKGFCQECGKWIDLEADPIEAERKLGSWDTDSDSGSDDGDDLED